MWATLVRGNRATSWGPLIGQAAGSLPLWVSAERERFLHMNTHMHACNSNGCVCKCSCTCTFTKTHAQNTRCIHTYLSTPAVCTDHTMSTFTMSPKGCKHKHRHRNMCAHAFALIHNRSACRAPSDPRRQVHVNIRTR